MTECVDCAQLPSPPEGERLTQAQMQAYRPRTVRPIAGGGPRSMRCRTHLRAHERAKKAAARAARIEKVYGISPAEQAELWAFQGERCGICGRKPGLRGPNTDHDHSCCPAGSSCGQCVRGMLCYFCNFELLKGYSLEQLEAAVAYLTDPPLAKLRAGRAMHLTPSRPGLMDQDARAADDVA